MDPSKLLSFKLTMKQIFDALQRNNAIAGGGYIEHQREQLLIRGEALATQVSDLARIVVAHGSGGVPVYIADVGEVKEGSGLRIGAATAMGEGETVIGMVQMLAGENAQQVVTRVKARVPEIQATLRYYYYFKELLVTFFFLPTFTALARRLRRWPKLRLFAAVFSAAVAGNVYYHLLQRAVPLAEGEIVSSLLALQSRMFYCVLLAAGVFVSMLREQRRQGRTPPPGRAPRVLRIFGVWTSFALIFIWDVRSRASLLQRVEFLLGLFGLA